MESKKRVTFNEREQSMLGIELKFILYQHIVFNIKI